MRILILEDNPRYRDAIAHIINEVAGRDKPEIVAVDSVARAEACMAQSRFDVLIADHHLGEHDPDGGIELVRRLRNAGSRIAVVMLGSESISDAFGTRARFAGADYVVSKEALFSMSVQASSFWRGIQEAIVHRNLMPQEMHL